MSENELERENRALKAELRAEHFILKEMALLGKVRNVEECNKAISNLLKDVGEFTKADRAYIIDENRGFYSNTYEWCKAGVESQKEELQNLTIQDMPYWIPHLKEGESILIEEIEDVKTIMPVEYAILKPQDIKTLIVFPIILNNELKAFIGVDNPNIQDSRDIKRLLAALGGYLGIIRENSNVYAELEYRLNYDMLTGAYNKYGFYKNGESLIKDHLDIDYCLIVSDVKNFKLINEIYGYEIADQILIEQVSLVKEQIKEKGIVGCLEGDKLAAIAPVGLLTESKIKEIIQTLSTKYSTRNFKLYENVGVYYITDRDEKIRQMVDKVNGAIVKNKGDMNYHISYYDEETHRRDILKQTLIGEFDTALKEKQFCMYLQPQTDKKGRMLGAEALVRWNHPTFGFIMPGMFIECLEEAGFIYKLDHYIWREAAAQLKKWKQSGYDYYISVNISVKDFYHMDVYKTFVDLVKEYEIDVDKIHIEITETALSEDEQVTHKAIKQLYDSGFVVEIDDFGSGYSSFNFLKDICADVIKIDRVFLKETSNEERGEKILQSIIRLSHEIGMSVISEGVESTEQLTMLSEMDCDWYQGFYFSKPISVDAFEEKYGITDHAYAEQS